MLLTDPEAAGMGEPMRACAPLARALANARAASAGWTWSRSGQAGRSRQDTDVLSKNPVESNQKRELRRGKAFLWLLP
ncbi:hypothetical protein E2F46_11240 [Luteimonas aestuarii]|uniref:Uncharacterized protein n=1 Tax=Luteimonas aestuarii TaxID=453837 RepID=A0A4R5TLG6_9GAMM|nr:hypothetical protein [Luteimonas aestuarii]TDK23188.1 hypothetical protein E2F46_11240 [Luteimonas aestuarii]